VPGSEYTDSGWEVSPETFHRVLVRLNKEYRLPPVYITENGAAYNDEVTGDARVHDPKRIGFIRDHLIQVHKAIADGVDVRGFFAWSLLDNLEWIYGFAKPFGLVHVNHATQKRIVKDSGNWYKETIQDNGFSP
jgi:beta-glucosidase